MKRAFVVATADVDAIRKLEFLPADEQLVVCSSIRCAAAVAAADEIHFVVSRAAMCSTALQELVSVVWQLCDPAKFWLLKLEDAAIPAGFSRLNALPRSNLAG